MAASVDIDLEVKQGLLELRSEQARLRLLARLFKDGDASGSSARERIAERAQRATARCQVPAELAEPYGYDHDRRAAAARVAGAGQLARSPGRGRTACAPPKKRLTPFQRTSW